MEQGIWNLETLWFVLIAVLWIGFFFLEGFDFGVGILLPFLGKDDNDRRVMINTIGPTWDGNEVWLLTAGGATFAAFPEWYATMFSGFYLPLFLILFGLIIRGVAFEYRSKDRKPEWRSMWDWAIFVGSLLPALLFGVAFGNLVRGLEIDAAGEYIGGFWALLNPYSLLMGIAAVVLFVLHGAIFLALKSDGDCSRTGGGGLATSRNRIDRGRRCRNGLDLPAGRRRLRACAAPDPRRGAPRRGDLADSSSDMFGWAFIGTGVTIAAIVAAIFIGMYPNVMTSTINPDYSLTVFNASSTELTLRIMSIVALIFVPIVLVYQSWSYWVFRKRVSPRDVTTSTH